ncbi:MAG: ABC transporter permease, partial [Deinococcales bacterium]
MAERTAQVAPRLQLTYEVAILIALLLIATVVALLAPRFLSTTNLFQVARNFSFVAAVGVGEAMVILTGRGAIDLSVGSLVSLGAVVVTKLLSLQVPIALAIAAGIGVGLAAGIVNGMLVTRLNIAPLVVTLGMLSVAAGLSLVITRGFPITQLGPAARTFIWLGAGFVGPVPMPVIYMALVVLAGWLVTSRTSFGYALFAVGGNQDQRV